MKIIALTYSYGGDASGIVVRNIIQELRLKYDVHVYTVTLDGTVPHSETNYINVIGYPFNIKYYTSYIGMSMRLFSDDILAHLLKRKINLTFEPDDIIISFVYGIYYWGIIAGKYIKEISGCLHFCYMIDPIPSPLGWMKNNLYRRQLIKFIRKQALYADYIALSNQAMVDYEKTILGDKHNYSILYTPSDTKKIIDYKSSNSTIRFLYTGSFYGARHPVNFIKAFKRLVCEGYDIYADFVGTGDILKWVPEIDSETSKRINVYPRTSNLDPFYKRASVLVDIDADLEDDIFLSSKLINYLKIKRPILCVTNINSPSYKMFHNLNSMFYSEHNPESVYAAMIRVINFKGEFDYTVRLNNLGLFDIKFTVESIENIVFNNGKTVI